MTSCIFLTGALQYGMRQSAETENLMTSVERVMEYGQIKSEADLTTKESSSEKNPDDKHFSEGVVEFDNVSLRYDEDCKLILKNITFKTEANDKIGIVGRTGAGKSSLIVALFRFFQEPNFLVYYLVQLIEHPILRIRNFNFPDLWCCKVFFSF